MALLRLVVVAVLAVCLSQGYPIGTLFAQQAPKVARLGHNTATNQPNHVAALKFAEIVAKKTNNRIDVKVFPAQQLGSSTEQVGSLKMGTQEFMIDTAGVASRLEPDFSALTVSFLIKNEDQAKKVYSGPILKEMGDKLLKSSGIRMLTVNMDRAPRHLLTKTPVAKLADVKGMKLRTPNNPIFLASWKALGAAATPMEFSEVYLGLQQGVIDGIENPVDLIYTQKFYEVVKSLTLTNHLFEKGALFVSEKFYQGLSPADQKAVQEAAVEAGEYHNKALTDQIKMIPDELKKSGVKFIEWSDNDKETAAALTEKAGQEQETDGKWTKGLVSKIRATK
jgi:tripartite ATP-independent transporter DctP family solute receptor